MITTRTSTYSASKLHIGYLLIIVGILFGAILLGGIQINSAGFWYDETVSIGFITDSTAWYKISPEQMPVYYLVLRGWTDIVGRSELAGRWLSLLFGLLTLCITYRLVATYFTPRIAMFTIVVLASSAFFVRYFREMRPYMLLALCCMLSMWFFLRWLINRRYIDAILFVLFSIAAIYTHYFAGLIMAVEGFYFLFIVKPIRLQPKIHLAVDRYFTISMGLFAVIALSIIPYLRFYFSGLEFVTSGRYSVFTLTPAEALSSSVFTLTNDSLAIFSVLVLAAIISRPKRVQLALLWAFFPLVLVLVTHTFIYKMFANPRYIIFIWPAFAIVAAMGILAFPKRFIVIVTGVLVVTGVLQVYNDLPAKLPGVMNNPPWREITERIGESTKPQSQLIINMIDLVGLTGYRQPVNYYVKKNLPQSIPEPVILELAPELKITDLLATLKKTDEVWLIATDGKINQRGELARMALGQLRFVECNQWEYPQQRSYLSVWERVRSDVISFENGIRLQSAPMNRLKNEFSAGNVLPIYIGLYTEKQILIDYSLGLYVLDETGQLIAQQDIPAANSRTSTWAVNAAYCDARMVTAPMKSGKYSVKLVLYDAISGQRVLTTGTDSRSDGLISFFSFSVK